MSAIRAAGPADALVMALLHAASFDTPWSAPTFATFLAEPAGCGLIAALEGEAPAGFALARLAADEAELLTIAVAAEARRRGLGLALMEALQSRLAARGARRLFLEVGAGNRAASALYRKLGFEAAGRRAGYYGGQRPPQDALVMMRILA